VTNRPVQRIVLVGWGAIARTAFALLDEQHLEVVAIAVRDSSIPRQALPAGAQLIASPHELADLRPDVVAEAASRESVGPWGHAALQAGADFIVSSVSALADEDLLESLRRTADSCGGQIEIQVGALGGIDALSAARLMGLDEVEHRIVKPPLAWRDTPAESLCELDELSEPCAFFSSTATQTASAFPKNANVAMTTALAGIGPHDTKITLVADPNASKNRHEITASGAFGHLDVSITNTPLPENPKTSAMAALSLVRAIQNRVNPVIV